MHRSLLKSAVCHGCRERLVDSVAALAGVTISPPPRPRYSDFSPSTHRRLFTHGPARSMQQALEKDNTPGPEPDHPSDPNPNPDNDTSDPQTPSPSTPWYLQIPTPNPPPNPSQSPSSLTSILLARQSIPPLPTNPPPLLPPLLTYLSTTTGLDNLTLLDLRDLQPPPALGANLLMIIGTARSTKHLNVSADRLCRWLRSNYKLRPYADGLLGRNELKVKLRRKARRQKLARSVGNTVADGRGLDDGITTGWVCVNVGPVDGVGLEEDAENKDAGEEGSAAGLAEEDVVDGRPDASAQAREQEQEHFDDGYIGFGRRSMAPRIVVQMFMEEKRAEMDLEGLWDFRSARRAARNEKGDALAKSTLGVHLDMVGGCRAET